MTTRHRLRSLVSSGWVLGSYALVALAFNWPLPLLLADHLTGSITGDTGVYVWNQWVFRHEAIVHHRFPLFTHEVLSLTPPVDLSLHNYTLFADLVAFPLIPWLGVTATFNVIYLAFVALTAWAMYELARAVTRRKAEAWLAGLLFGFSPVLMARAAAHFSLAAAAPLPLFLLALRRAERDRDLRFAALAGAAAAWASTWDAYYGIFCVLIAACYLTARFVRFRPHSSGAPPLSRALRITDVLVVLLLAIIAGIVVSGGGEVQVVGMRIGLRSLHTPVLLVTLLLALRAWLRYRPAVSVATGSVAVTIRLALAGGIGCVVVLLPVLWALQHSLADGAGLHGPIYWRSSPPGVDLLSFLVPNPNLSWVGERGRAWLAGLPNGYVENVASLPFVGLAVIGIAVWWYRFRPTRVWLVVTFFLGSLALGPFVRIGGVDTHVPTPWALLRYLPIVTATRTPTRYAIPLMMAFSLLFAMALVRITSRHRRYRPLVVVTVGAALILELSPFPRPLYPAHVPEVYRIIARDTRQISVLNLPFGIRSGEWSEGDFSAASQFFQTVHEKRLIGGYLSRVGPHERDRQLRFISVRRLAQLSEGQLLLPVEIDEVKQRAGIFMDQTKLGYVVVNVAATPPALRRIAIDAYGLVKLAESDGFELYAPGVQEAKR